MSRFKDAYLWVATWVYIKSVKFMWYGERKLDKFYGDRKLNGK